MFLNTIKNNLIFDFKDDDDIYKNIDEEEICLFCLESSTHKFYNYDLYYIQHHCDCTPSIHEICFLNLLNYNETCIICRKEITKIKNIKEKCIDIIKNINLPIIIKFILYIFLFINFYRILYLSLIIITQENRIASHSQIEWFK